MPIKPENKHRYPKNWKQIRAAILERAGNKCEQCGVPNHVWRKRNGREWTDDDGLAENLEMEGVRVSKIVLTIAHLDHVPENCEPGNLLALCQRCHLRYDAVHHRKTAYKTRRNGKAEGDLFDAYP